MAKFTRLSELEVGLINDFLIIKESKYNNYKCLKKAYFCRQFADLAIVIFKNKKAAQICF